MSQVFISYSRKDQSIATELERRLTAQGVKVWLDKDSIAPAENWSESIQRGIDQSVAFLLVWSSRAAASEYVQKEINLALRVRAASQSDYQMLPYRVDDTLLPEGISALQGNVTPGQPLADFIDRWTTKPMSRQFQTPQRNLPLESQGGELVEGLGLVRMDLGKSIHCKARLWTCPDSVLAQLDGKSAPQLAIFVQTTRAVEQDQDIRLVQHQWLAQLPGEKLFLLQISGPVKQKGNQKEHLMKDDSLNSEWLDVVATTHAAILSLIGTRAATLHIFAPTLVPLGIALGWRLDRYWHVELYHFRQATGYQHVFRSEELGR